MAGVKGRSGRRRKPIETARNMIIDRAWRIISKALDDPNTSLQTKLDISKLVVSRDISRHQHTTIKPDITYITKTPRPMPMLEDQQEELLMVKPDKDSFTQDEGT